MRLFHAQLLRDHLEGDGDLVLSSMAWTCLLSRAEALKFICVTSGVSGGTPQLTLTLAGAADFGYFETSKALLSQVPLSSTGNTFQVSYSASDSTNPPPKHLFLEATLNGTDPKALVEVWVCGRGPQLLEATPPAVPSFQAQYAAAKMLEDEDRLPGRKRALPPGASLFYPPELFLPSLKWDR